MAGDIYLESMYYFWSPWQSVLCLIGSQYSPLAGVVKTLLAGDDCHVKVSLIRCVFPVGW